MYKETQVQDSVDLITYKSQFSSQKCCETTLASWTLINLCVKSSICPLYDGSLTGFPKLSHSNK